MVNSFKDCYSIRMKLFQDINWSFIFQNFKISNGTELADGLLSPFFTV